MAGAAGEGGAATKPVECLEEPKISDVLVLVYNPILHSQNDVKLRSFRSFFDPKDISVRLAAHMREVTNGKLNYRIHEFREINEWPPQLPGATLDEVTYLNGAPGATQSADYGQIFDSQKICDLVVQQNLSEVWLWGGPNADVGVSFGFPDFAYRLPGDVIPEGAPAVDVATYRAHQQNLPDCGKAVWVMGFDYTAELDWALLLYDHRVEHALSLNIGAISATVGVSDPFAKFSQIDRDYPGDAQVGRAAIPPNAGAGTNGDIMNGGFANPNSVPSGAADWLNYPSLTGEKQPVNCSTWGCTLDGYQRWYQAHIPSGSGASAGVCNDWWTYAVDFEHRLETCSAASCPVHYPAAWPCAGDDDCSSGLCRGLNQATVCVTPNWFSCSLDSDCLSGVCDCATAGGQNRECLPNSTYRAGCLN
ncbi:MAG TPA: hypothetical protein VNW92_28475 [Polyangiaceae bacterium]|jgi:hypothetical protein|nr:hypothetical protein [Polyangiaceae bacterium]